MRLLFVFFLCKRHKSVKKTFDMVKKLSIIRSTPSDMKQIWMLSSAGRASPLQGEGRGFDPLSIHHVIRVSRSGSSVG